MGALRDVPLLVVLVALTGLAMLVPAAFGLIAGDRVLALAFAQWAGLVLLLAVLTGLAVRGYRPRYGIRSQFLSLMAAYAVLPLIAALPLSGDLVLPLPSSLVADGPRIVPRMFGDEAIEPARLFGLPDAFRFHAAWFEMVSSFTTTGASLIEHPASVAPGVHLWRSIVGWLGGFFVLFAAVAILAPANLGGVEVETGASPGRVMPALPGGRGGQAGRIANLPGTMDDRDRLLAAARLLIPVYGGLTAGLWLGLILAGDSAFVAACHAMAVMATSGISPVGGLQQTGAARAGEVLILVALVFAVSRRALPGRAWRSAAALPLRADAEVRTALVLLVAVIMLLWLRQMAGAAANDRLGDGLAMARALWGSLFTAASFLTTTGFVSADWAGSRLWSGLAPPGLVLAGLAVIGGGVATTAGGIGLLRLYALWLQGRHEVDKLLHPSMVGGDPPRRRRIRAAGSFAAWLTFMLVVSTLTLVIAALTIAGLDLERAVILAAAAVSTTGPLAGMVASGPVIYADLSQGVQAILAVAMVLGRLELLAVLALLLPGLWRA